MAEHYRQLAERMPKSRFIPRSSGKPSGDVSHSPFGGDFPVLKLSETAPKSWRWPPEPGPLVPKEGLA